MRAKRAVPHILTVVIPIIIIDQFTKYLVRTNMTPGEVWPDYGAFIKLWYTLNDGIAFSMFAGLRAPLIVIQTLLAALVLLIMIFVLRKIDSMFLLTAFSLMLGGGVGNLIDRVAAGAVTDFISIGSFAIFNVADASLTIGCVLLIVAVIFRLK